MTLRYERSLPGITVTIDLAGVIAWISFLVALCVMCVSVPVQVCVCVCVE